jgi:hypothetical protein
MSIRQWADRAPDAAQESRPWRKPKGDLATYSSRSDPVSRGADFCRRVMPFRSELELWRWIWAKSGCF